MKDQEECPLLRQLLALQTCAATSGWWWRGMRQHGGALMRGNERDSGT
jgi:hypothetical protein